MASDNFDRANETPLASPWVQSFTPGSPTASLSSNHVVSANVGEQMWFYTGSVSSADQFSQATVFDRTGTSNDWGPACRVSNSSDTGYWAAGYDAGSVLEIYKVVSGAFSSVTSFTKPSNFVNGDVMRCEVEGTALRYIKNGATIGSATDSSITAQNDGAGFFFYDTSMDIDDWSGGNLAAVASSPDRPLYQRQAHLLRR